MNIIKRITSTFCMALLLLAAVSCGTGVTDAVYPAQKIYLPAAVSSSIYLIDKAEESAGSTPTEGSTYRFLIDYDEYTFSIPLSVYRSGVDNHGNVAVDVYMDDDVVYDMILDGTLPEDTDIIPIDLRECTERVIVKDGQAYAAFNVVIDLDYLMDRLNRHKELVFGVSINTDDREMNEEYCRLAIIIDTTIFDNI
ncbi:MAG: hypothetical protein NC115_04020 [Bacteroidales bacterium]|nr:hypothetical protein [Bacteroidales bacterium]